MPFTFKKLEMPGLVLLEASVSCDDRGLFVELYKTQDFGANGIVVAFRQINYSKSEKNVVRGLHYQLSPKAQSKLIVVTEGEIFDVVVDIRKGSPTFGRWMGERLSGENKKILYVPEGFAHGFGTLSDQAEIMYCCSEEYAPDLERSILWNDPELNIAWPVTNPVLSRRDAQAKPFRLADNNFEYGKVRD